MYVNTARAVTFLNPVKWYVKMDCDLHKSCPDRYIHDIKHQGRSIGVVVGGV